MLKLHKIALLNIILSLGACGMPYASQLAEDNSADQAALLDIFTMQGSSNTSGQGASFRYENRLEFHLLSENHQFLRKLIGQKIFVSIDYFFPTNLPEFYDDKSSEELFEQHVRGKLDQLLAQQYDHFILTTLPDLNVLHFTLKEKAMNEARFLPLKAIQAAVSNNDIRRRKLLIVNLILEEVGQARSDRLSVVSLNKTFVSPVLENNFHDDHLTSNLRSAFAQDLVHFNDAGQALIFNLSLKKAIENLVPGERISPMKLNGAPAWQQELSLMFYSKNSLGFVGSQNNGTF